jgi:hypothetical protein
MSVDSRRWLEPSAEFHDPGRLRPSRFSLWPRPSGEDPGVRGANRPSLPQCPLVYGTLALTALAFDHSRIATAQAPIETVDSGFVAGEQLIRQLDPRGLRHVFVLSEGLQVNGSDLLSGINAALPPGVSASGGFAADGTFLQATLRLVR